MSKKAERKPKKEEGKVTIRNFDRNGNLITDWDKVNFPPEFVEGLAKIIRASFRADERKARETALAQNA